MTDNPTAPPELQVKLLRRLEQALKRSKQDLAVAHAAERRLRTMMDQMPVGLALVRQDGRFFEVNGRFCETLGYPRSELLELTYLDVTHPDDRETDMRLRARLRAGELPTVKWEKRYVRKDGSILWANFNLALSRPLEGEPQFFLAVMESISERVTLEASLRGIATNLAQTEAMARSGTWDWNVDTGEITASPEALEMFALVPSPLPMRIEQFLERIDPDDRAIVETLLQQAVNEQKPYQMRYRLRLPDGSSRIVLASGEVYERNERNKPRVMIGIAQDITLHSRTEQALIDSERRFRLLFDNAADGIFIADRSGTYTDVNSSASRMLGYTREELIGKHVTALLEPADLDRLMREKEYFLQNADYVSVAEWPLRHKDGHHVPAEVSARILPDGRWLAIARDISERKRTLAELDKFNAEIRDLYDNAPCGYHTIGRDGTLVQINETELRWLGYARDEAVGKLNMIDVLTASCLEKFQANLPRLMQEGQLNDVEFEFRRKDGSRFPVLISATAVYGDDGSFMSSRMTAFDTTALDAAQKKLRQAAAVFEHTTDAILITSADGSIVAANKAFARISGYRPEEVIGKNPNILKSGLHDQAFYDALWSELNRIGTWQGEIWDRKKSGEIFPVWESITAVKDDAGTVTDYISVFSDITSIKETEQRLTMLAYHDPLTGLPNRLLFNDRMMQAVAYARRHQTRSALLLLDLDRFKLVNDTLGHAAGDLLLKAVGIRLKDAVRAEDTVSRLGGDEFAIILNEVDDPSDAAVIAQKVAQLISEPINLGSQTVAVSTSVGIAIFPDDADDPDALARCADAAMYSAKNKGRNGYQFYTREMTAAAAETLLLDRDLRRAIKQNELSLVYQPQIDLSTGRIVGVEALARWNRPDHGPQSPARFIRIAEETDLIESIGEWAVDTALNQLDRWRTSGIAPIRMALNLSMRQVRSARFMEDMRRRLVALHPEHGFGVDIELTETSLQSEAELVDTLNDLKSMGLKIAIDDFGTGYSSLNSLKHLPVDSLKIDSSFIHGIATDSDDRAITSAIIAMGHSLGMNIVAEGVETQEQLQFVRSQHCDEAQGFLFYPPLDADECHRFLVSGGLNPTQESSWTI